MTHILIADDHPLFRAALTQALRELVPGAKLVEVATLDAVHDWLDSNPDTDLVLLDLHMPGSHGLAGLASIRCRHPAVAVAMISANDDPAVISRAIDPLHEMVLSSMGVTDIVHPEEKAAESLARKLNLRRLVDQFELPGGFVIAEIVVPDRFVGKPLAGSEAFVKSQLGLVTVLRKETETGFMGRRSVKLGSLGVLEPGFAPEKGDILVLFGTKSEVERFTGTND